MPRRFPIAFPSPHFMAFAPLDVWVRMLGRSWVPPRYWLRLVFGLFTSVIGTALTLPERVVVGWWLWAKARRAGGSVQLEHEPGVVVILGYFRSGTTHLHYLMSCDPQYRSPRWCEVLAPQGFVLSWAFLRVFMIPFVSAKRPQDDVAIGPEWPAEDDFGLCNGALASSLPGRFVVPRQHGFYDRYHALEGLSERELLRWRRAQWGLCWKIGKLAGRRAILLKTPSHTARVGELRRLLGGGRGGSGAGKVKFVHISREPEAVVRSNVAMARRLEIYNLQDPPEEDDVEARITAEYIATERKYLREAEEIPAGEKVQVRYEDLIADPLGELKRVYAELGLRFAPEFERRVVAYLHSVKDYRAATKKEAKESGNSGEELQQLAREFGHGAPARAKKELPPAVEVREPRVRSAAAVAGVVAAVCGVLWVLQAWLLGNRHDFLVWPVGFVIGMAAIQRARVGSVGLGVWAAALTAGLFVAVALPGTFLAEYYYKGERYWEWYHISLSTRRGLTATNNLFWLFMGCVTAYRFASRKHVRPPGT